MDFCPFYYCKDVWGYVCSFPGAITTPYSGKERDSHDELYRRSETKVRLQEGVQVIEQPLVASYMRPGISTKELARHTYLPVPITAAIKKELIKAGALIQERGVRHLCREGVC